MKSWIRRLLTGIVMVAFLFVNTCALADTLPKTEVVNSWGINYAFVTLNRTNGTLMVYDQINARNLLVAPDGTILTSEPYEDIHWEKEIFTVKKETGVNKKCLMDKNGKIVIPM
ncbi:MAG: hypothetical protein IJ461_08030, partial [Clostridia bacterium]|nr:hypothetical protein [Clostridia bacterium]